MADTLTLEPARARRENRRRVIELIVAFAVLAAGEGALAALVLRSPWPVAASVALAGVYVLAAWLSGDRVLLSVLGAERVTSASALALVSTLATQAGGEAPALYLCPGDAPNAIAPTLRKRSIVVTRAAIDLGPLELEAMLAHELAHIQSGDAMLGSLIVLIGGAPELAFAGAAIAWLGLPVWPACIVLRIVSRAIVPGDRELRADVGGALITRYPPGMRKMLLSARVQSSDRPPQVTQPFWTAQPNGADMHARAEKIAQM